MRGISVCRRIWSKICDKFVEKMKIICYIPNWEINNWRKLSFQFLLKFFWYKVEICFLSKVRALISAIHSNLRCPPLQLAGGEVLRAGRRAFLQSLYSIPILIPNLVFVYTALQHSTSTVESCQLEAQSSSCQRITPQYSSTVSQLYLVLIRVITNHGVLVVYPN